MNKSLAKLAVTGVKLVIKVVDPALLLWVYLEHRKRAKLKKRRKDARHRSNA